MIHGQKKSDKTKNQDQLKQQNQLSEKITQKLAEFFSLRKEPINDEKLPQLIEFTSILMQLCNDITSIFNFRREIIGKLLEKEDNPVARAKILGGDIKLISKIMQQDPKSYTLWSYRQWLVLKIYQIDKSIVDKEKQLCKMMLMKDQKNFHVWNYRNWVNSVQLNLLEELEFTKSKINQNPFNFSPYHFRSKLIIKQYSQDLLSNTELDEKTRNQIYMYGMPKTILNQQFETIRTAIFLNPKQEAPWLYYSWLLKQLLPALLLDVSEQKKQEEYKLIFSLKVADPTKLIQCNKQFIMQSTSTPSDQWILRIKQKSDQVPSKFELKSTNYMNQIVNIETTGRKIIGHHHEIDTLQQIKEIYDAEEKFVREVIESEDGICRFGWSQVLEIYNNMLYLGIDSEQWARIIKQALLVFSSLDQQSKGAKYIQKQHDYWRNLANNQTTTKNKQYLKSYYQ